MNFNKYWDEFRKQKSLTYNYDEIAKITWEACKQEILKIIENDVGGSSDLHLIRLSERLEKEIKNL